MKNKNLNLIRFYILKNCFKTKEGHVGSAFSILEIIYVIFIGTNDEYQDLKMES